MSSEKKGFLKSLFDFFLGGPDKSNGAAAAKVSTTDRNGKPKSAAQLRKERNAAKRRGSNGVRYGGDRRYVFIAMGAIVAIAALSPISLMVANSKVSEDEVRALVEEQMQTSGREFPTGQAVMWAGQVLRVWGTWNEENKQGREVAIAPYLSSGMDSQAGWNGAGTQEITYTSVNPEPNVIDANHATVDAVYQIGDGSWRCVSIPTFAYKPNTFDTNARWAFALAGNPTPVGCSPRTGAPAVEEVVYSGDENRKRDDDLGTKLASTFFPGFFSAWAGSDPDALAQYMASGIMTTGLGGAMASNPQPQIGSVGIWVDEGGVVDGVVYNAVVPVTWALVGSSSRVSAEYVVPVKRDGDRWFIAGEPRAAQQATDVQGGAPPAIPQPGDGVGADGYPSTPETPSTPPATVAPTDQAPTPESTNPPADEGGSGGAGGGTGG